jgi:single-stranded-DNA-specific exonuclease
MIYILVDCDCDGLCSSAEIYLYLLRYKIHAYLQPLFHHGKVHGLDDEEVMHILTTGEQGLLIIPDASGSEEQYKQLVDLGYEILCIDHHQTQPSKYAVTINNKYCNNDNIDGAGADVVFQFLRALDDEFGVRFANHYVDLCAIGNIGDVMDMTNPYNRTLNYYGLTHITNPFLSVLCDKFIKGAITPHSIAWNVVPKFNSVIRSDDNELKEELFWALTETDTMIDFDDVANRCDKCHQEQKRIVKKIADLCEASIHGDEKIITLQDNNELMSSSYTGLIAGKISGDYNKPCVIIKENGIGSIRSPIAIRDIFNKCEAVDWCNGHDCSAGIKINDIDKFRTYCKTLDISSNIVYDCIYSGNVETIPLWFYEYFDKYIELYGKGVPKPQFHIRDVRIAPNKIKSTGKNNTTLKFTYKDVEFIMFFANQQIKNELGMGKTGSNKSTTFDILGELNMNTWNGKSTPQVIINKIEKKTVNLEDLW